MVAAAKMMSDQHSLRRRQVLVRLDNSKTYLLHVLVPVHVPSLPSTTANSSSSTTLLLLQQQILLSLSSSSSIPTRHLRILTPPTSPLWSDPVPHLSATFHLPLRGGKGGFGTLLKGQSKQAGAKTTLDFGACRDLSGRRLRHINDEVKLRKWRDAQSRRDRGLPVDELDELRTESGIRNWHLMVPSWADGAASSNKARWRADRAMKREVERWKSEEEREVQRREEARARQAMAVAAYVRAGEEAAAQTAAAANEAGGGTSKKNKVLEIMMQKKKVKKENRKRGRQDEGKVGGDADAGIDGSDGPHAKKAATSDDSSAAAASSVVVGEPIAGINDDEAMSYLCTLSGDVVVDDVDDVDDVDSQADTKKKAATESSGDDSVPTAGGSKKILLQSQSEFATAAVLLGRSLPADVRGLYYEVKIRTGGLAQIGWAYAGGAGGGGGGGEFGLHQFRPNSDTGDGVGDDDASFGYDGYRGLAFHAGEEKAVASAAVEGSSSSPSAPAAWKDGDVVGCTYHANRGVVTYSLNGKDAGVTFEVRANERKGGSTDSISEPALFPAVSLNQGEIVQINVGPDFDAWTPADAGYAGVCEFIDWGEVRGDAAKGSREDSEKVEANIAAESAPAATSTEGAKGSSLLISTPGLILPPAIAASVKSEKDKALAAPTDTVEEREDDKQEPEKMEAPFDLNKCQSLSEAKELGMDRLKEILLSMGCKCGGSLDERAERLFSLKGLKREDYPKKVRGKGFVV